MGNPVFRRSAGTRGDARGGPASRGATSYTADCYSSEQCCMPAVRYQLLPKWREERSCHSLSPGVPHRDEGKPLHNLRTSMSSMCANAYTVCKPFEDGGGPQVNGLKRWCMSSTEASGRHGFRTPKVYEDYQVARLPYEPTSRCKSRRARVSYQSDEGLPGIPGFAGAGQTLSGRVEQHVRELPLTVCRRVYKEYRLPCPMPQRPVYGSKSASAAYTVMQAVYEQYHGSRYRWTTCRRVI